MKLGRKLIILTISTILIPMLLLVSFAAFRIFYNTNLAQWEYLESVGRAIEEDIVETESNYLHWIKEASDYEIIRTKLYVYEKYWNRLSDSSIAYDLESLASLVEDTAFEGSIETFAVYRRDKDAFRLINSNRENLYQPYVIYKNRAEEGYNRALYYRSPDGIFMQVLYPVFSDGKLVGLLLFMKIYDDDAFKFYRENFGIEIGMVSKNKIMFNSDSSLGLKLLDFELDDTPRQTFSIGGRDYSGYIRPFEFSESAKGHLFLYSEMTSANSKNKGLLIQLLLITLICVLIPVVAFFLKELKLIRYINELLSATDDISMGNYDHQIKIDNHDELGLLAQNFNGMVAVLKTNRAELEQKNSELELKNSYIDAVFQSLKVNIVVLDYHQIIRVISRNAQSRLELTEESVGHEFLSVDPFASSGDRMSEALNEVYAREKFVRLRSINFGSFSYEVDFYPIRDEDRSLSAVVVILNNITDRMNIERALAHSDRLASIGTLAAGLAHEINNPLGIILNHIQLIGTGALDEEEQVRYIDRIESEIKRVSRLINNLLKFSREDTSSIERINPSLLLVEVLGLTDPGIQGSRVDQFYNGTTMVMEEADSYKLSLKEKTVKFFLPTQMLKEVVISSRDSLKQIFFNIIKNSINSLDDDGGIICCDFSKEPGFNLISFCDNGRGIEADEKEKVFDLFYSNSKGGTGIGLPLCRSLMGNIGGSIEIEDSESGGLKIILRFPIREDFNAES